MKGFTIKGLLWLPASLTLPALLSFLAPAQAGIGVNVKAPPAPLRAAVGDGVADDTAALQAAIVYGETHRIGPVYLPSGVYKITAPLVLTNPGAANSYTSIMLVGDGPGSQGAPTQPGTTILMAAAGQDCILKVAAGSAETPGQFYNCYIEDIWLVGHHANGVNDTAHGIHWTATGFNAWTCRRVSTDHVSSYAYQLDTDARKGSQSLNGENLVLDQCRANYSPFYRNTSGQAYSHVIQNCQCSTLPGQTMIQTGYVANGSFGGFGLLVTGFSASADQGPNGLNQANVFLDVGGICENVKVDRCRVEHCGQVLRLSGGSVAMVGHVTLEDSTFTDLGAGCDCLHRSSINAQPFVRIKDCQFQSIHGGAGPFTDTITVPNPPGQGDYGHYVWEGCIFDGYASVTLGASAPGTNATYPAAGVVVNDCWMSTRPFPAPLIAVTK